MHTLVSSYSCVCMLQLTLEAVFGNAKGEECIYLWRQIGGILVTLLPAVTYTLRVSRA